MLPSEQPDRITRTAAAGAVGMSVAVPLFSLLGYVTRPPGQVSAVVAAAILVAAPVFAGLTRAAITSRLHGARVVALPLVLAVTASALPWTGVSGLSLLYVPLAITAGLLSLPYAAGVILVLPIVAPLAAAMFGRAEWGLYYATGTLIAVIPLAVVIHLARAATALRVARARLAEQAVVGERLRLEAELEAELGRALREIVTRGEAIDLDDAPDPVGELEALTGVARSTLARTRRLLAGHRLSPSDGEVLGSGPAGVAAADDGRRR